MAPKRTDGSTTEEEYGLHYLWHLEAIGLLADGAPAKQSEWLIPDPSDNPKHDHECQTGHRSKVAIIDNGATEEHPNLIGARMPERLDFATSLFGSSYDVDTGGARADPTKAAAEAAKAAFVAQTQQAFDLSEDEAKALGKGEVPAKLSAQGVIVLPPALPVVTFTGLQNPAHRFAAHGTACAGLVGANANRPGAPTEACPTKGGPFNPNAIPYTGVDPYATVVPINTVYSHEYWPLIMALHYARAVAADVILFPRAVEEMLDPTCGPKDHPFAADAPRHSRFLTSPQRLVQRKMFEDLLRETSEVVPVVVPAGNSGPGPLEYPARLAVGDVPVAPKLIVVGAATAYGTVASYSAGAVADPETGLSDDVLIYAPGDDREDISDDTIRYDDLSWRGRKLPIDRVVPGDNRHCPYGILAIDIPGPYGYSIAPEEVGDLREPGASDAAKGKSGFPQNQPVSLYTLFGGTSAAASIVAGTISQMHRVAGRKLDVDTVRDILASSAKPLPNLGDLARTNQEKRFLDAQKALNLAKKASGGP